MSMQDDTSSHLHRHRKPFRPLNTLHSTREPGFRHCALDDLASFTTTPESYRTSSPDASLRMVRERDPKYLSPQKPTDRPPLANISAKMQSPATKASGEDTPQGKAVASPPQQPEFGKASPLRNPLRKQEASIFLPKSKPRQMLKPSPPSKLISSSQEAAIDASTSAMERKPFYLPGQAPPPNPPFRQPLPGTTAQRPLELSPTLIPSVRTAPPPTTSFPPSKPQFSSLGAKTYFQPFQAPRSQQPSIDLTKDDDDGGFDPDAAIRAESSRNFGAPDPYSYVDSAQANENIKNLLEGAFDEAEDEKTKGRKLRSRAKRVDAEEKKKATVSLADKLAGLSVKAEPEVPETEEDEDEEDGTVDGMNIKLLPHQVEGVKWMIDKESGQRKNGVLPHGGILADDMGLGKTVQSVALILTNPRPAADAKPEWPKQKMPGKEVSKSTLVVAPLALIKQWESEIKTKVLRTHTLRVLVHHGPSRTKSAAELKKYDVVITTYQTLTSEHAGSAMNVENGARIGCFGVSWYRVILDEAHSIKNRNAKSTQACYALPAWYRWCLTGTPMQNNLDELQSLIAFLKIKPYCEMSSWKSAITQPMKAGRGGLAMQRLRYFLKAFMKRRTKDILKKDGALNFGGGKASSSALEGVEGKKPGGGMQIVAREVITVECEFDEMELAFYTRLQERADKRLKEMAAEGQKTDYIGALVLLLRLRQACNHTQLISMGVNVDKDTMATGLEKAGGDDMDDLTRMMGGVSVESKACEVCQVKLTGEEMRDGGVRCAECEADLAMMSKRQRESGRKSKQKSKKRQVRVEKDILRRKGHALPADSDDEGEGKWIADGPEGRIDLGKAGGTDDEDAEGGGETLDSLDSERSDEDASDDEDEEDSPPRAHRRRPGHIIKDEDDDSDEQSPDSDSSAPPTRRSLPKHNLSTAPPSTKIRHLLRILHRETPKHKVIVFSQFTSMLDLITPHLVSSGLHHVRYDGSMRNDAREASLASLKTDPKTRVLLCSLKCGSLGLNLTAASRVVIVEPFWNPFVEEQAIDRVHRLNQTVDVKVYKLTVMATVEERILALQEKKRELAKAAIEGGKMEGGKLSMKDVLALFRHDAPDASVGSVDAGLGVQGRILDSPVKQVSRGGVAETRRVSDKMHGRGKEDEVYGRRW